MIVLICGVHYGLDEQYADESEMVRREEVTPVHTWRAVGVVSSKESLVTTTVVQLYYLITKR